VEGGGGGGGGGGGEGIPRVYSMDLWVKQQCSGKKKVMVGRVRKGEGEEGA